MNTTIPETGFIRERRLLELIPVSRSTIWKWRNAGRFPSPVKLYPGSHAAGYRAEEVREWIASRGAEVKK